MTALRKPSIYAGLEEFQYDLGDIRLVCWVEYEKGEKATWEHPGSPDNAILWYAEHKGEDIAEILSDEQRDAIEIAFLEQDHED